MGAAGSGISVVNAKISRFLNTNSYISTGTLGTSKRFVRSVWMKPIRVWFAPVRAGSVQRHRHLFYRLAQQNAGAVRNAAESRDLAYFVKEANICRYWYLKAVHRRGNSRQPEPRGR